MWKTWLHLKISIPLKKKIPFCNIFNNFINTCKKTDSTGIKTSMKKRSTVTDPEQKNYLLHDHFHSVFLKQIPMTPSILCEYFSNLLQKNEKGHVRNPGNRGWCLEATIGPQYLQKSKWVWSGNTTITNRRQPCGTARKSQSTITRHQEDKLSKATSSLFPIKMIAILERTQSNVQQNIEQLQTPTMGVTINKKSTTTEPPP